MGHPSERHGGRHQDLAKWWESLRSVHEHPKLTALAKLLFIHLWIKVGCRPKSLPVNTRSLGVDLSCERETAGRLLNQLKEHGLIDIDTNTREKLKGGRSIYVNDPNDTKRNIRQRPIQPDPQSEFDFVSQVEEGQQDAPPDDRPRVLLVGTATPDTPDALGRDQIRESDHDRCDQIRESDHANPESVYTSRAGDYLSIYRSIPKIVSEMKEEEIDTDEIKGLCKQIAKAVPPKHGKSWEGDRRAVVTAAVLSIYLGAKGRKWLSDALFAVRHKQGLTNAIRFFRGCLSTGLCKLDSSLSKDAAKVLLAEAIRDLRIPEGWLAARNQQPDDSTPGNDLDDQAANDPWTAADSSALREAFLKGDSS